MKVNNDLLYCTYTATILLQFGISIYQIYKNDLVGFTQIISQILESYVESK